MRAIVNTIMIIAGSASEAIIISRLEPMPPKLVPTSMPASARKKRALPSSATMAIRSAVQLAQLALVLALAPLLSGLVRRLKAHMLRRQGPPLLQPYRDLLRLLRKEVVLAHSASWVFRATPYLVFAATWVGAALVPTFATGLLFSYAADMIAIVALRLNKLQFLTIRGYLTLVFCALVALLMVLTVWQ